MQPNSSNPFYCVSMGKFTLLFLCTMGYYQYYWFYKNWKTVEYDLQRPVFPVIRSVAAPFFILSLFYHFKNRQSQRNIEYKWSPDFLAWFYIGSLAFKFLINLFVPISQGSAVFLLFISLFIDVLNFYVLYQAQLVCNRIEGDPFGESNKAITFSNKLGMLAGAFIWAQILAGVYLIASGQMKIPDAPKNNNAPVPVATGEQAEAK